MINAVGNPQTLLLLGGTSEIGLTIVEEYLRKHPPASSSRHCPATRCAMHPSLR